MALVPITLKVDMYDPSQPGGVVTTLNNNANLATTAGTQYTMADIIDTVNTGTGGVSGSGNAFFVPIWGGATVIADSDIERTASYTAPDGGQYELRGNLKIFGESSGPGVASLYVEDDTGANVVVRDVVSPGGAINTEFEIKASDAWVSVGTTVSSTSETILINALGTTKMALRELSFPTSGSYFCLVQNGDGAIGAPAAVGPSYAWDRVFFDLPAYADDAAANAAGILPPQLWQTDGTGAAPLNVAGIVMIKQ